MSGSFKTDSMLFLVFSIFIFIPNEIHNYILASVLRPQNSDTESKSSQFPAKLKLHFTFASFCLTFPFCRKFSMECCEVFRKFLNLKAML
jgi:hypothetical protein